MSAVLGNIFDFAKAGQDAAQGAAQQFQQAIPGIVNTASQAAQAQIDPLMEAARQQALPLAHEAGSVAGRSAGQSFKTSVGPSTETIVIGAVGVGLVLAFGTAAYFMSRPEKASLNAMRGALHPSRYARLDGTSADIGDDRLELVRRLALGPVHKDDVGDLWPLVYKRPLNHFVHSSGKVAQLNLAGVKLAKDLGIYVHVSPLYERELHEYRRGSGSVDSLYAGMPDPDEDHS